MTILLIILSIVYLATKNQAIKYLIDLFVWLWLVEIAFGVGLIIGIISKLI